MKNILECPVCRNPLRRSGNGFRCARSHNFDAAREGYVNLLPVQKKNSKEPGDSREMIRSRTRFLDLGLYDRISESLDRAAAAHLPGIRNEGTINILDAGCGEGFYLKRLKEFLGRTPGNCAAVDYYGVDISKFAVRQAARRDRSINWFVAGVHDLPFAASSFDLVLNVFSPAHLPEFSRVLRPAGCLVTASPGPHHLDGLRRVIYAEARQHAPSAVREQAKAFFSLSTETRVNYPMELKTREAIMDLLAMTPYFWNIDRKTRAGVEALEQLALDADVEIRVFRKKSF